MIRSRPSTIRQARRGFTLIELLVVISIIAVLVSLVAPAVQAARRTARKMECLSNMRQVGIAMQAFSATNGYLPTLTADVPINITVSSTNYSGALYGAGWPMALLPALDAAAVLRNVKAHAINETGGTTQFTNVSFAVAGTVNATDTVNTPPFNDNVYVAGLTCPDDTDSHRLPGGLSFVVNAGMIPSTVWGVGEHIAANPLSYSPASVSGTSTSPVLQPYLVDWTGNGLYSLDGTAPITGTIFDNTDQQIALATGVFFRATAGSGSNSVTPSLDYVSQGDGQTTTLMISENLQAGPWNGSIGNGTAFSLSGTSQFNFGVNQLGFGLDLPVSATNIVMTGSPATATTFPTNSTTNQLAGTPAFWDSITNSINDSSFINRNLTAQNGLAPRPSSQHAGGVNVIMCDGSGRYLNETMDKKVYMKLITPNGTNYGEATLDSRSY